jgi:hypothetical protein
MGEDERADHGVERSVSEGQVDRFGGREAELGVDRVRHLQHAGRGVDADGVDAEPPRDLRGDAGAGADVEHALAGVTPASANRSRAGSANRGA